MPGRIGRLLAVVAVLAGVAVAVPAAADPVDDAVGAGSANAAGQGITAYISVVDRGTGVVAGETANAHTQVASESIMKLFIAGWYAVGAGGWDRLPASRRSQLEYMIKVSDDGTASALFNPAIIPDQAGRYGLTETANANPARRWGAARITAHDMSLFLYRMSTDAVVGPWLMSVMTQTAPNGSDGFDQRFGFNALSGEHGSKQGWGSDNFTAQVNAVHSVGFTDRWFAAVLQTGGAGTYLPMRGTADFAARLIQAAPRPSADNPIGNWEGASANDLNATFSGWALDPNDPAAGIQVDVYDTGPRGVRAQRVTAGDPRPDVNAVLGVPGDHGFAGRIALVGGGIHRICLYAINVGAGDTNPTLGCREVAVQDSPIGVLDTVTLAGFTLTVAGWAVDSDQRRRPAAIHVYDTRADGSVTGYVLPGPAVARPDVAAAYPGVGPNQGFRNTIRVTGGGSHRACAYAINVDGGGNSLLGCRNYATPLPLGSLDEVTAAGPGAVRVRGWSADPDVPGRSIQNHVYVIGPDGVTRGHAGILGNRNRPDVAAVFPALGAKHGFMATVPAPSGVSTVCAFAISVRAPATNPSIGCRTVTVP